MGSAEDLLSFVNNTPPAYAKGPLPIGTRVQRVPKTQEELKACMAHPGFPISLPTPVEVWDGKQFVPEARKKKKGEGY